MHLHIRGTTALGACGIALSLATVASAGLLDVPNGGFEEPVLADGGFSSTMPGWTAMEAYAFNPRDHTLPGGPAEGDNVGYIFGLGSLNQVLDVTITGDTRYELNVEVAARSEFDAGQWHVSVFGNDSGVSTLIEDDFNSFGANAGGPFQTVTIAFDVLAGSMLIGQNLEILLGNDVGGSTTIFFDDVRLSASSIPAPAAMALFVCAGLRRRRRRDG